MNSGMSMGLGGGFEYQYVLGAFLDYQVRGESTQEKNGYKYSDINKSINYMRRILERCNLLDRGKTCDLLLEGHTRCFEDINFLYTEDGHVHCCFIQSKTQEKESDNKFFEKCKKIIMSFHDNVNLSLLGDRYRLIIVHNFSYSNKDKYFKEIDESGKSSPIVNMCVRFLRDHFCKKKGGKIGNDDCPHSSYNDNGVSIKDFVYSCLMGRGDDVINTGSARFSDWSEAVRVIGEYKSIISKTSIIDNMSYSMMYDDIRYREHPEQDYHIGMYRKASMSMSFNFNNNKHMCITGYRDLYYNLIDGNFCSCKYDPFIGRGGFI